MLRRLILYSVWAAGAGFVVILACNIGIYAVSKAHIYEDLASAPDAQVALIPGAAILDDGSISSIFIDRIDMAVALYRAGKVDKILVSGDNSTVGYNEVNPVRLYLISKGVPDEDIFLDHAGFDTYSTMYRARDIFGVTSVLITTQSFHLPRSIYIARAIGLDANGVNSDVGHFLFRNYIREAIADEKAVLNVLFRRTPKYLGKKIPIDGDGRLYP